MTEKTADKFDRFKQRKAQLEPGLPPPKSKAKKAARTLDTRRKIIIGGRMLAAMDTSPGLLRNGAGSLGAACHPPQ